jgi:hypothetical protein
LELFIKYQIPSDLISYEGNPNLNTDIKLKTVKGHVAAMQAMIKESQDREIQEKAKEFAYSTLSQATTLPPAPIMMRSLAPFSMSRNMAPPPPPGSAMAPPPPSGGGGFPMPAMAPPHPVQSVPAPVQSPSQPVPVPESAGTPYKSPQILQEPEEEQTEDYTKLPTELDKKFELLDEDSALRPTIIKPGTVWTKRYQKALLAEPAEQTLLVKDQEIERTRTFDLLDALSRSGVLSIDQATLHVVLAATHCFDKNLIDTVIKDNVNPIEKVERSTLIVATTIHNKPAAQLVKPDQYERVSTYSPVLFGLPAGKRTRELIEPTSSEPSITITPTLKEPELEKEER